MIEAIKHFLLDVIKGINELNKNIDALNISIKDLSVSSNEFQKNLFFGLK